MVKLQKFQTVGFTGWASEVTKANHIDTLYHKSPQLANQFMVQLAARNFGKALEAFLTTFPTKEFEDDSEYYWNVIGSARRNIPLVQARDFAGNVISSSTTGNVGVNGEPFYLVFGEAWFFNGEELFGNLNEVYPMLVKGAPRQEGTHYVYTVELSNGSNEGIPAERLLPGERFSYNAAPVSRGLSREVGGVRHVAPATMRNEWTTIRLHDKVSGDLMDKKVAIGVPALVKEDASGKMVQSTVNKWMFQQEYDFERTWAEYKNNMMAYSASNRNANGEYTNFDQSGEVIRKGDGLYMQMKRGNEQYYNTFSLKLLEDVLLSFSVQNLEYGDRTFVIRTGEFGMRQFSNEARSALSGWLEVQVDAKELGLMGKNATGYFVRNPQVTEWFGPNNLHVKIEVDPSYDDNVHNKILHPMGGVARSYRYDIFDLGTSQAPNIFKCAIKGKPEYRGFMSGMRNPWTGATSNPYMSYAEDSASIHRMATFGVCVLDPTRTMSLIPSILSE